MQKIDIVCSLDEEGQDVYTIYVDGKKKITRAYPWTDVFNILEIPFPKFHSLFECVAEEKYSNGMPESIDEFDPNDFVDRDEV